MNKPPAYNIPLSRLPWFYLLGGLNGFQCTIWQLLFCLFTDQFSLSPPTMLIYWPILSIFLRPPSPWFSLVIYWPVLLFSSHPVPDSAYYLLNNSLFLFSLILFVYCTTLSLNLHTPYMCLDAPQRSSSWRAGLCMSDTEEWSSWSKCFPGWPAPLRSCASAAIPAWCALVGRWQLGGWVSCPPSPHLHLALVHSL